ncbi:AraC family transcriptional regulator [Pseudomonas fluorescens]|uniref:AraC family transcriptional regulator n=1 Tax=Pseudomonas fluorescens TaxID=294 RepID=UPI001911455B|nr:AraC family transcriptional regulator [Pseudomonas fluorescens]
MTDPTENLIVHPEVQLEGFVAGDLLSEILAKIRLTGDRVFSVSLDHSEALALDQKSAHICMLREGVMHIRYGGEPQMTIRPGDVLLLPQSSSQLKLAAGSDPAEVVICRFWFDASSFEAMVFALPWAIHISAKDAAAWSEGILHFMLIETDDIQPGGALMVSRLIDLVVIRILRTWVRQEAASGWLKALSDPRIARAMKAIHQTPGRQWSNSALAAVAGMSRSNFCERFNTLVGRPPLRYQNEWRLSVAKNMLANRHGRVGEIGYTIGYESEAAFSRAYKAFFGCSPRDDYGRGTTEDLG